MEKNNFKKDNIYVSEEEKTLNWVEIQSAFKNKSAFFMFFNLHLKIEKIF